ncbi:MAG: beta-N-acetylhexosaminidase [Nitrospinae bacterium]|nr:beta-N-acetylhexosaminidase [Nitrospinota bacterium]
MSHEQPRRIPPAADARQGAGRLLTVGFDGTRYDRRIARMFDELAPAGVILFSRNIESADQTRRLIADLKKLNEDRYAGRPLFVAVDQEGGRVARLSADQPKWPTARSLGADGSAEQVEEIHRQIGRTVRNLGFNVDFAPVLDLDTNPDSPVIGDRSFSADPEKAARLGRAAIRGLQGEGVLACGKHFPGHGDTRLDSHLDLPEDTRPAGRFRDAELVPFIAAIEEEVAMIMTAHVIYPAFDPKRPGTLSPYVVTDLLRHELRFNGVIVGDDMDMKAIAGRWGDAEATLMAVEAGCDQLLVCHETPRREVVHRALMEAIESGAIGDVRFAASSARIDAALAMAAHCRMDEGVGA